ncbi:hypothetical protein [Nocardia terpenica]|uniref:DUF3168 domain-containing protein n=1 Tax=Nocardia terpenica TaxID=455432 RepID=A0A291RC65_9NOCA|nr:hypothetical protein [Nocardia terpenica]ATL65141.1 hypothetical protein CRH09_01745 [Nocardia terpenica]
MTGLVVYPAVESLVVAYLARTLAARTDQVVVATKVPAPRPDRLVRVTAAGGGNDRFVLASRLVIVECWDIREPGAADLAELCHALLLAARRDPAEPAIRNTVTVGAPVNHPDPDTHHARYQCTVSIDLRGRPPE